MSVRSCQVPRARLGVSEVSVAGTAGGVWIALRRRSRGDVCGALPSALANTVLIQEVCRGTILSVQGLVIVKRDPVVTEYVKGVKAWNVFL